MRVIVTGSRNWEGPWPEWTVYTVLQRLKDLCDSLGESELVLVHGDCPTGADRLVDAWGRRRGNDGVQVEAYPANWRVYGKAAGPVRNTAMVDAGADMCIGFHRGGSTGTGDCVYKAREAQIPTFVVAWDQEW